MASDPEDIPMDAEQKGAYEETQSILQTPCSHFAPFFSLVPVRPGLAEEEAGGSSNTSANAANAGTSSTGRNSSPTQPWFGGESILMMQSARVQPLQDALNQLQGLDKKELLLVEQADLTRLLTSVITKETYTDPSEALQSLISLGETVPRRVCQHPFRKNDIVWVCRTCQADETCVLCHNCFSQSNHEGHDVNFYHAQAGGCCDCGDPDAWDSAGFCPNHGPAAHPNVQGALDKSISHRVTGAVPAVVDWMVHTVAASAELAYQRAHSTETVETRMTTDEDETDADAAFTFVAPHHPPPRPQQRRFSPSAASNPRSHREETMPFPTPEMSEALGRLGAKGRGLFLVLHADDVHLKNQVIDALRQFWGVFIADMMLGQMADALKQYGQLIVWGTHEIVRELGPTQTRLWMDGDRVVSARVGDLLLEKCNRLSHHGLLCSIVGYDELLLEQRAVATLQWLSAVARSCDPLCQTVAECILPNRHLVPLLRADFKMSSRVTKAWYSLLLTLLAVPAFKSHLAAAYCDTYRFVTAKYSRGMGVLERSGYTLSVQFLNRVTYVIDLVQRRDLLGKLGKSLLDTFTVAAQGNSNRVDPNHFVLAHRRYAPCVSDLKCVLNVKGMPKVASCAGGTFLEDWMSVLRVAQFMDPQTWRHWDRGHVEDESRGWVGAFNASISLGSLFERLLGWKDEDPSPIPEAHAPLMTCVDLTFHVLTKAVARLQEEEMKSHESTANDSSIEPHKRAPNSLPFSTVASRAGTCLAMQQMPVSQVTPFSFHVPLHRFVASALRELCLRTNDAEAGMACLMERLQQHKEIFWGLMEFPVLVLSRVAQVRSDLWKRNGSGLNDQVLNYAEPPFCRNMRDADLLMTQFAVLGRSKNQSPEERPSSDVGMAFLSNMLLHRLGIFDFCGFYMAPNSNIERYTEEVERGMYPGEKSLTDLVLPWTYSPARDTTASMKLLEEFLHFIIIFIVELPPVGPKDREDQTRQAKFRLFREVVHRLASGPKTHSELSEVHHVLSHWDNILLSEEGKLITPDDATSAALEAVLSEVADRKTSRGSKPEPDKWQLRQSAWQSYNPSFYHLSLRNHQIAADSRPKPKRQDDYGWEPTPFTLEPTASHPFFSRLRRDATADSTVVAVVYKVLHIHCSQTSAKDLNSIRGKAVYEAKEKSETALARAVHFLTLGAFAWSDARREDRSWRVKGGGSAGSIFYTRMEDDSAPTAEDWVTRCLLQDPQELLDCDWYEGEDTALVLLHRLAMNGGATGGFIAQDSCVRAGAAWLCMFAATNSSAAAAIVAPKKKVASEPNDGPRAESELQKRKRIAKEKAMARMKAQADKFKNMMDMNTDEEEFGEAAASSDNVPHAPNRPIRAGSFGSTFSGASSTADSDAVAIPNCVSLASEVGNMDIANAPSRLLQTRPRCIICNDEESSEPQQGRFFEPSENDDDGDSQRRKSRRKGENALGFVGYSQASTVLKGGGGLPPALNSSQSPIGGFVGTHVALCGHAVHFECCESYLATVSQREDRAIGKRDEFRCPLCQRLSNCLVPFIDVGVDWIESPACHVVASSDAISPSKNKDDSMQGTENSYTYRSLDNFLDDSSWWVTRRNESFGWDGHSAFIDKLSDAPMDVSDDSNSKKTVQSGRSLKKKDLYAAWNAMMRTPRFVRRRLRPPSRGASSLTGPDAPTGEDSSGETLVWRRFMDQIADIGFKADNKRLGETRLHEHFGEFRHYIVERYAYNISNTLAGGRDSKDWPACMFDTAITDTRRQEMSREKLISKLLVSIQAFTYSCCCEGFEAMRSYRRISGSIGDSVRLGEDGDIKSLLSKYGISGVECDGHLLIIPRPSSADDGGSQPFNGRLGKLRYLALAMMSATGAIATDIVQLVLSFPVDIEFSMRCSRENPRRSPIAYPLLFGHVMTHVTTALFASCGRARAQGDSIDTWQVPSGNSIGLDVSSGLQTSPRRVDDVINDCEGFIQLGLLARLQQVLLGKLQIPCTGITNSKDLLEALKTICAEAQASMSGIELEWMQSCTFLLRIAFSASLGEGGGQLVPLPEIKDYVRICAAASGAACVFLSQMATIFQILVPGMMARYDSGGKPAATSNEGDIPSSYIGFEKLRSRFNFETVGSMLESTLTQQIVKNWFWTACTFAREASNPTDSNPGEAVLCERLRRTQGFRPQDWPSAGSLDSFRPKGVHSGKGPEKFSSPDPHPHDDSAPHTPERASIPQSFTPGRDMLPGGSTPVLVNFSSRKSVPLIGGFTVDEIRPDSLTRSRIAVLPTSYTDLYAELGSLMPDCEQTAVCLICGEVLNAGGKGECTKHAFKCGAGAGMFFLLQECSGLILHKSKAAYIHSPYVDSHGETPQYRGRPLNLDLNRYDHLREVWFGHGVRQQVVAERQESRQVILPDFY